MLKTSNISGLIPKRRINIPSSRMEQHFDNHLLKNIYSDNINDSHIKVSLTYSVILEQCKSWLLFHFFLTWKWQWCMIFHPYFESSVRSHRSLHRLTFRWVQIAKIVMSILFKVFQDMNIRTPRWPALVFHNGWGSIK